MPTQEPTVIAAINALENGHNVEIIGGRFSGRSTLAGRVAAHYRSLKWTVLQVPGRPMLRNTPLAAAALAGLGDESAFRVAERINSVIGEGKALLLADDWDYLDSETWAALVHVHQRGGHPILVARELNLRAPGPFIIPGVRSPRAFQVPTLDIPALAKLAETSFHMTLDSQALANLAALSRGNAGGARALLASALEEGLLAEDAGVWHLTQRTLWSQGAAALAEALMASFTPRMRDTLEKLSALGPTPVKEATSKLGVDALAELSDVDIVGIEEGDEPRLTITSALLDEHLRRQHSNARFAILGVHINADPLPQANFDRPDASINHVPPAVRLASAYVSAKRAIDRAAQRYASHPSLGTAAAFIETMRARDTDPLAVIDQVLEESADLGGTDEDIIRWDILNLEHRRGTGDSTEAALARLREHSRAIPSSRAVFQASEARALISQGEEPDVSELPTEFDGMMPESEAAVNTVKFGSHVLAGRLDEARKVLPLLGDPEKYGTQQLVLASYFHVAEGRLSGVVSRLEARYLDAVRNLQFIAMPDLLLVLSVLGVPASHCDAVKQYLQMYDEYGAPALYHYQRQGIATARAAVAWRLGQGKVSERTILPHHPYPSALPGCQPESQEALELAADHQMEKASELVAALAQRQWEKGHRLAAAFSWIFAAVLNPRPELVGPLREQVSSLGGRGLSNAAAVLVPLCRGNLDAVERILSRQEVAAMNGSGAAWQLLASRWRAAGNMARAKSALERASKEAEGWGWQAQVAIDPQWTDREKEVIRYLAAGLSYRTIAETLNLSARTIEGVGARAMKKANVSTRAELIRAAGLSS